MILVLGYYSVQRENQIMFLAFITGDTAGIAYFSYKLYMIYVNRLTDYLLVYKSLTVFGGSLSILLSYRVNVPLT
jgi:hypothetical protein